MDKTPIAFLDPATGGGGGGIESFDSSVDSGKNLTFDSGLIFGGKGEETDPFSFGLVAAVLSEAGLAGGGGVEDEPGSILVADALTSVEVPVFVESVVSEVTTPVPAESVVAVAAVVSVAVVLVVLALPLAALAAATLAALAAFFSLRCCNFFALFACSKSFFLVINVSKANNNCLGGNPKGLLNPLIVIFFKRNGKTKSLTTLDSGSLLSGKAACKPKLLNVQHNDEVQGYFWNVVDMIGVGYVVVVVAVVVVVVVVVVGAVAEVVEDLNGSVVVVVVVVVVDTVVDIVVNVVAEVDVVEVGKEEVLNCYYYYY
ncbi:hypothetical protein WICMUC_003613 [Wickerhamomyces mucosus]|uniref:Uncharacterized protein n=1 Tax=Wickerhamomyces mucosus TaxID=1378264 RepID=A0A9P8PKG6_9ASCO|nr:hypothetical protein WICMUC_003613 [Wickerhamomyces mucosus]